MPSESDPLLPRTSPADGSSISGKSMTLLVVVGAVGAITAGWAYGSILILVARSLDLMVRKTTDGSDDIFHSYLRLVVIASVGKLLQYISSSWITASSTAGMAATEREVVKAASERASSVFVTASCAITGIVYMFIYDWKLALCALVLMNSITCFTSCRSMFNAVKEVFGQHDLKNRVAIFWDRASSFTMLNASVLVQSKLKALFTKDRQQGGLFGFNPILLSIPAVLAFPYMASKVRSDPTCATEHCGIAVSMAVTYFAITSVARAKQNQAQNLVVTPRGVSVGAEEDVKAIEWTAEFTKPFQPSLLSLIASSLVAVVGFVAWYVIGAYGVVWLFEAPTSADAKLGTTDTTTVMAVVAGGIILHSVASEFWAQSLQRSGSKITEALVSELVTARMNTPVDDQAKWPVVDSEKLLENATSLGLSAAAQYSRRGWSALIGSLVCVGVAVYIDPLFAGAVLVERVLALTPSAWKALQRRGVRIPGADAWFILCVLESVLRCGARVAQLVAGLVLLYVQIQWVAQGRSTLFSTLAAKFIIGYAVDFFVLRGSPSLYFDFQSETATTVQFYGDDAVAAAVQFQAILGATKDQALNDVVVDGQLAPSAKLDGDLTLEVELGGHSKTIGLRRGQLSVAEVGDDEQIEKVTTSVMRLRRVSAVRTARIGNQDLSKLPATNVRDRVMVVDSQPVTIAGTVNENVKFVRPTASDEEVNSIVEKCDAGGQALGRVDFSNPSDSDNKVLLLLAQIRLRNPDVLIIHDNFDRSSEQDVQAIDSLRAIPKLMPSCQVLILTTQADGIWTKASTGPKAASS